jgi:uncharacterized membrane protein HdeD (DUF308 family)
MISFKAANPNRSVIRGTITVLIGIVLICVPGLTLKTVIQLLGGFLMLDGFINFMIQTFSKKAQQNSIVFINRGMPNLIFGLILVVFPTNIVKVFVFLIGIFLVITGVSLLISQFRTKNLRGLTLVFFILGLVAFLSGIAMLSKPFQSAQTMMIALGAIVTLFGIGEILWSFKIRKHLKQQPKQEPQTIDADYEEVD